MHIAAYREQVTTTSTSSRTPSADQLLVLLEVARSGRYTTAAQVLGLTHTTVARNVATLERALGGRVLVRGAEGWELTDLGSAPHTRPRPWPARWPAWPTARPQPTPSPESCA